jgi:hypothetical protein
LSSSIDFMDHIEGELNRRLAVLALLYIKRRTNAFMPDVSLTEVELRMGFPRDYLEFTTWYLQKKGYITRADNSAFALTAEGVDFVESQRGNIPMLHRLLTSGAAASAPSPVAPGSASHHRRRPIIVPHAPAHHPERRSNPAERRADPPDRRSGQPDPRSDPAERRMNADRRSR